ncbi:MAG: DMT family transporter [Lachnospiraceae bacterium]|nr:DMT family transporter [Lachnospiraceae bacterium]
MKKSEVGSASLLFLAAFIWGVAFVAQSLGMEYVGPFTFNGCRFLLGGLVLTPVAIFREKQYRTKESYIKLTKTEKKQHTTVTLLGGLCCGIAICIASSFQQVGMLYTSVGKAGFITALYIVLVPVLGIFLKKKVAPMVWAGIVLAAIGTYFLCITESFSINQGDLLIFACAICFSFHILIIDYFAPKADGVALSCIQFWFSGIISMMIALITENPEMTTILQAAGPILYAGIMSCGVAYTLQILGQKHMKPAIASLILSLESVISVLAGWLILQEVMTKKQLWGCVLVFLAVILAQVPAKNE